MGATGCRNFRVSYSRRSWCLCLDSRCDWNQSPRDVCNAVFHFIIVHLKAELSLRLNVERKKVKWNRQWIETLPLDIVWGLWPMYKVNFTIKKIWLGYFRWSSRRMDNVIQLRISQSVATTSGTVAEVMWRRYDINILVRGHKVERRLGRLGQRCVENIKMDRRWIGVMIWIRLNYYRIGSEQWALLMAVLNLRISAKQDF
jgi:hypothetical protein